MNKRRCIEYNISKLSPRELEKFLSLLKKVPVKISYRTEESIVIQMKNDYSVFGLI